MLQQARRERREAAAAKAVRDAPLTYTALKEEFGEIIREATGLPIVLAVLVASFHNPSKGWVHVRISNRYIEMYGQLPSHKQYVRAEMTLETLCAKLHGDTAGSALRFDYHIHGMHGAQQDMGLLRVVKNTLTTELKHTPPTVAALLDFLKPFGITPPVCPFHPTGFPPLFTKCVHHMCQIQNVCTMNDAIYGNLDLKAYLSRTPQTPRPVRQEEKEMVAAGRAFARPRQTRAPARQRRQLRTAK